MPSRKKRRGQRSHRIPSLDLDRLLTEITRLLPHFSAFHSFALLDRTDATLTARIYVAQDLHVQVYANAKKNKLNLALIHQTRRLYGEDAEGGIGHIHPFEAPEQHETAPSPPSLEAFLAKVQHYLEAEGLI